MGYSVTNAVLCPTGCCFRPTGSSNNPSGVLLEHILAVDQVIIFLFPSFPFFK